MVSLARLLAACCLIALVSGPAALAAEETSGAAQSAAPKAKKVTKKPCKKGYKRKTVTRKGKKVKVCRKVRSQGKGNTGGGNTGGGQGGGPASLFEAPGKVLEGSAAIPFLQRYLNDSTFTTCPAGWPNCGPVEERYSHHSDGAFYYCRLTSVSGSDILYNDSYGVTAALVDPDGTWTFRETVPNGGANSVYEWRVATDGTVTGAYQYSSFSTVQQLGPFKYVAGARICNY